ncbi:DDE_Tnp_1_7 domain-containing protein [Trichonephila clavipes]|uniref:DDE_Tnp_1_7 domain-containing protein n=1 Tax=Trichonephila clavipes TaxID=2585209 RepID=A0A8X6RDN6_TRICX|nr:DDE_Tnp_1_7 domain-containing protein [Trichonephila clavipes]
MKGNAQLWLAVRTIFIPPGLADTLVKRKIDVNGTFGLNRRDLSRDLKTKKFFFFKKRRNYWVLEREVTVITWKDKKDVSLISTIHTIEMQNVTNERGETKSKPKCVVDYNDQMGGADKVDQHLAPYFTSRKREENTNIFFHLLDLAL